MFRTFSCPSSGVLIYRLFHCRMWCYAIGVEAVVLRSWCVVWCTVCQLVVVCFCKQTAMYLQTILLQCTASYNSVYSKYDRNDISTHLEQSV